MTRKLFAGGPMLVVCVGLFLAGQVSSQDPPQPVNLIGSGQVSSQDTTNSIQSPLPSVAPDAVSLEQQVQELKNVREQKAEFDRREKQLIELIAKKIREERSKLDQKIQERRQQLDRIENLLYPAAKRDGTKAMKEEKTEAKQVIRQGKTVKKYVT
jgi:hypothetical protein